MPYSKLLANPDILRHHEQTFEAYKCLLQNPAVTSGVNELAAQIVKDEINASPNSEDISGSHIQERIVRKFHALMTQQAIRHVDMFIQEYTSIIEASFARDNKNNDRQEK